MAPVLSLVGSGLTPEYVRGPVRVEFGGGGGGCRRSDPHPRPLPGRERGKGPRVAGLKGFESDKGRRTLGVEEFKGSQGAKGLKSAKRLKGAKGLKRRGNRPGRAGTGRRWGIATGRKARSGGGRSQAVTGRGMVGLRRGTLTPAVQASAALRPDESGLWGRRSLFQSPRRSPSATEGTGGNEGPSPRPSP